MNARFVLIALALAAAPGAHAQGNVLTGSNGSDATSEASLSRGSRVAMLELPGMKMAGATSGTHGGARSPTAATDPRDDTEVENGPLTYGLMALGLIGMGLVAHRRNN